jgi:hypothetical protein
MTVLPTLVAPAASVARTTGEVAAAGACVLAQSGLPNPVTRPLMSKLKTRERACLQALGESMNESGGDWPALAEEEKGILAHMSLMAKVRPCSGSCC